MPIKILKSLLLVLIIFVIGLIGQYFFSNLVNQKIRDLILNNQSQKYSIKVHNINSNLFSKSITLEGIRFDFKRESFSDVKSDTLSNNITENISIQEVSFKGLGLLSFALTKKIIIEEVTFNDVNIFQYKISKVKTKKVPKVNFDLDSIELNNLNGLQIEHIVFNNFNYQLFDPETKKIEVKLNPINFELPYLEMVSSGLGKFKLKRSHKNSKIENLHFEINRSPYDFFIGSISYGINTNPIVITDFNIKPSIELPKLANNYPYLKNLFEGSLDTLSIYNLNLSKLIKNDGLYIDSLEISQLNLNLFKDKNKPSENSENKILPHVALKNLKHPLLIKKLIVKNSNVLIEEKLKGKNQTIKIPISKINIEISNINSLIESANEQLKFNMDAILMNAGKVTFQANFPLKRTSNTFYFKGGMGTAQMHYFDRALFPVMGLKVLSGEVDRLSFNGEANSVKATGRMIMLYHDLEAKVFKSHSLEKNKFLSWTVNTLIHKSNPKHKKQAREVIMDFERNKDKGLGNFIWKTLETGLVNTIAPGGKQIKSSRHHKKG